jgi:hypothetical protein
VKPGHLSSSLKMYYWALLAFPEPVKMAIFSPQQMQWFKKVYLSIIKNVQLSTQWYNIKGILCSNLILENIENCNTVSVKK